MFEKNIYKTYQEKDGKAIIDLVVTREDDLYNIEEKVHNIVVEDLTTDELNLVLSGIDVPQNIKMEIKRAILDKQMGAIEDLKSKYEELKPRLQDDAEYIANNFEIEYRQFEERIKKEIIEMEQKLNHLVKKDDEQ